MKSFPSSSKLHLNVIKNCSGGAQEKSLSEVAVSSARAVEEAFRVSGWQGCAGSCPCLIV